MQKVQGDWLWVGQAWVKKQEVVAAEDVIEEFDVARNGDLLIVPVEIAGQKYPFLVDTGSSWTVVDSDLKAKLRTTGRSIPAAGFQAPLPEHHLPGAFVGNSRLPVGGKAVGIDLDPFRSFTSWKFRGILGMTFLKDKIVRIDFDAGKLAILRSCPNYLDHPLRLSYTGERPLLDIAIAKDRTGQFLLDTGCQINDCGTIEAGTFDALLQNRQLIDAGRTTTTMTAYGLQRGRRAQLKQFRTGEFEHADLGFKEGRINKVGLGYLSRYRVTFDFRNHRIYLQKGQHFDDLGSADLFGVEVAKIGCEKLISSINPSSPAAQSGLREGDRIHFIDGVDTSDFSWFEVQHLFAGRGRQLRLVVQGDDEPREVTLLIEDRPGIR